MEASGGQAVYPVPKVLHIWFCKNSINTLNELILVYIASGKSNTCLSVVGRVINGHNDL